MGVLRTAAIAFVLAVIGAIGVAASLVAASVAEGGLPPAWVVGFAFLYCAGPAAILAWLAWGGIHLVERLWTRTRTAHTVDVVAGRGRLHRFNRGPAVVGASGPAAFHAPVVLPAAPPPSPKLLGVAVAVPLAFLNVPGWLAVEYGVVETFGGAAAIFVVPGVVCGVLIGALVEGLRRG